MSLFTQLLNNKITYIFLLLIITTVFIPTQIIKSQSSSEISGEIRQKREELENAEKQIGDLESQIKKNQEILENAGEGLPQLEAEIRSLELQLELNTKQLEFLEQQYELFIIEQAELLSIQAGSLKSMYRQWKTNDTTLFQFTSSSENIKVNEYSSRLFGTTERDVAKISYELLIRENELGVFQERVDALEKEAEVLAARKQQIQNEINYYQNVIANSNAAVGSLRGQIVSIETQINSLLVEQQEAARREAAIIDITPPPSNETQPEEPVTGGFVITGKGRDLHQGHGVGMSQWGAHGAANAGYSAEQILRFYYTNIRIEARAANINVQGYGVMDSNKYVAGLGEVPDKACGTQEQVTARPDKYVLYNANNWWGCWPEEAIKAQVIAARSYAIYSYQPICTSAACQVYEGHTRKQWAADETKDLVIVSNGGTDAGRVINALYSSDNSQGSGTADNDTIFQTFDGNGSPHSYLRAVNDSGFATPTTYTNWQYTTMRYSLEHLYEALDFVANSQNSGADQGTKNNLKNFLNGVNGIDSVSFERDGSQRVKKVWIKTTSGQNKSIGGWWFKSIWNSWQYDIGRGDYIYSQTFFMQ